MRSRPAFAHPGQSADARVLLGQICLGLKDPKAAEEQFEAALLLQPGNVDAQLGVARAQVADHRFADALHQLVPLSKSQPRSAEIFELLAQAYSGLGKEAEAARAESRAQGLVNKAKSLMPKTRIGTPIRCPTRPCPQNVLGKGE